MGKYHKTHAYQLLERYLQYLHGYQNGSAIIIPHLHIVDIVQLADRYDSYGTYVNDEYVDNHDYDEDTDDDNDHKKDSYTAAGAAPTHTRPNQALDRCCEALDRSIMKDFSSFIDMDGSQGGFIASN